jgi:hypothetical protein
MRKITSQQLSRELAFQRSALKNQATTSSVLPSPVGSATAPGLAPEIDNQMSVTELRQRLEEVKAIESEAHRLVALRRNWTVGVAECIQIMNRLKPRAAAIRDEYKRMLTPPVLRSRVPRST